MLACLFVHSSRPGQVCLFMSEHPARPVLTPPIIQRQRESFHGLLRWSYVPYSIGQGQSADKYRALS